MSSRTQLRLAQVSGSYGSANGQINDQLSPQATGSVSAGDMAAVISNIASAVKRIHGGLDFNNTVAGHFNQNLHVTGSLVDFNQATALETAAGALTLDGKTGIDLKESGTSILNIADNRNVTVSNAAAIDIDGSGAVSIDSTAGSVTVGAALADGQTLKLGKSGAAELSLEPHGTPASEKISLINTAGTADDAIKIDAVAGGLTLAAGDDSLHLDADGTDADALNIDSAGGMDVDVAGVLDMAAGDDSVIAVTTAAKDLALTVSGGGAQVLQLNSAGTGADAIDINATAGGLDVDVSAAINIATTGAAGDISLVSAHTAGVAVHIDADANAGSIVDIDAGILDVASTGKSDIVAGGAVNVVGGAASKLVATAGNLVVSSSAGKLILSGASGDDSVHVLSDFKVNGAFTIAGSLTVPGDLTVNGTTTTLDTTNLNVQDKFIFLADGAQALNTNAGLLFSSGSSVAARPDIAVGRLANDSWGIGSIANPNSGTLSTVTGMTSDVSWRASKFEVAGSTNFIDINSSNIRLNAAAAIELAPASKVTLGDDKKLIFGNDDDFSIEYDEAVTDTVLLSGSNAIRVLGDNRELQFNGDARGISASGNNLMVKASGAQVRINAQSIQPNSDDGAALGGASNNWSDLYLADSAVANFGDDQDVTLTHVHDTGLLLNSSRQLQFGDNATTIAQVADGVLHHRADVQHLFDGGGGFNSHFSGSTRFGILDNSAQAFAIQEGANNYLAAITTNGSEKIQIDKLLDLNANLDMQASSDIVLADSAASALEFRDASAALYLSVNTSANQVGVPDNIKLVAGTGGDLSVAHNGTDSSIENGTGIFQVRQRANAQLIVSGGTELQFGDGFSGAAGMTGGVVPLAVSTAEFTSYISNFANNKSIIGALNDLASGGTRAKLTYIVSGSHTAGVPVTIHNSLDHDGGQNPAATDVYVNGQLMLSGTEVANGDYKLHGVGADRVAFFFALDSDDVVQVIKA